MKQPLEGIRVLDFTHALAGSACTNLMARFGAEVLKVERPDVGDDLRHYTEHAGLPGMAMPFCSVNAGKKSIVIDLKNAAARAVLERLIRRSDILVENFRPGVPKKLGIDWESVRAINPKIVYCSVTGFGQSGELRDWPAYDHIVQAISGIMWMNGEPDRGPMKVGLPAVDTFTGYVAALGVLAALRRRDATGEGEFIDVAMLDSALTLMASAVATQRYTGKPPVRQGNRGFRLVPTSGLYATSDGYLAIGANHQHQVERLFKVLERDDLLADARFMSHKGRIEHAAELHAILKEEFARRLAEQLELQLTSAQVPAAMVRTIGQITDHPHARERGILVNAAVPGRDDPIELMRGAPKLAGAADEVGSVPALGQHTEDVLLDAGLSSDQIAELQKAGAVQTRTKAVAP